MPRWPDRLLHPSLCASPEVHSRARLTVVLTWVLMAVALAYAAFYVVVVGFLAGAAILAAGAGAAALVLPLLRVRPWLRACGHLLTSVLYVVLVILVCHEGGLNSIATPWLMTPPIFAILLLGRREALGWTALGVLTVGALYAIEARGVRFPVGYPAEWGTRLTFGSHAGLVVSTAILIFVFEDIRARAQARAEEASEALARLAYQDALTGLANRARFLSSLDVAIERARAAGDPARVAVLLLDLDGFKGVNDSMGHAAGDELLVQVAARLGEAARAHDTVARLGGDEFAVLLDDVRADADAGAVAARVVAAVARPFALGRGEATIGASVGLARATAGDAAAVLHEADVAMYRAKTLGRGRWRWHESTAVPGLVRAAG